MSYSRVIPRDFFNEAKLLKCLGAFVIEMERWANLELEESGEPFDVQMTISGELYCSNYQARLNGKWLFLYNPYNSKESYPMYARIGGVDISVFNDMGTFSPEFLLKILPKPKGEKAS